MSQLKTLREARSLRDLSRILGVQTKAISFLLYKLPDTNKYRSFEIPKRNGERRLIRAPEPRLMMLQRRLADTLYRCVKEIYGDPPDRLLSHGFLRSRSIFTNASVHKNRRYVLNLDLKDFFPSLNFGRVRGFFIKDRHFELNPSVATVVAQIACHKNELPQGSPCSPIISNLLGHLLDVRLVQFARKNKCVYSRYADDLTISTNIKIFPPNIATPLPENPSKWRLSVPLVKEIEHAGYEINEKKTRMQLRGSRQVATGLVVNKKVNIRAEYYRNARAICNQLFTTGTYYITDPDNSMQDLKKIEGILSHVHYIKDQADLRTERDKRKEPLAIRKLYRRFLIYKYCVAQDRPVILSEGKTDPLYLRHAFERLTAFYPKLGRYIDGEFYICVQLLRFTDTHQKILQLGGGATQLNRFISHYRKELDSFGYKKLAYPVIVLVDNDDGAQPIFSTAKGNFKIEINHKTTKPFYHLCANLYLVKTPENRADFKSSIEDLFVPELLETLVDGKKFDRFQRGSADGTYGKSVFARRVVIPNAATIDFSGFGDLLERFVAVLEHYEDIKAAN